MGYVVRLAIVIILLLIGSVVVKAQTFTVSCSGSATAAVNTARFTNALTVIGVNQVKLVVAYTPNPCQVNTLTFPSNITLDLTSGTRLSVVTGQVVTIAGPLLAPQKTVFVNALAGQGSVLFTGNTALPEVYAKWWDGSDAGAQINAADTALGLGLGSIIVTGGGTLNTQVTISSNHRLYFAEGTYTSNSISNPVIRLKNDSTLECSSWAVKLSEPTGLDNWTLIKPFNNSSNNHGVDSNITVRGCQIIGANAAYNSTQQVISLGNCQNCTVENNFLNATKAIGIQAGGGSASSNYAKNVRIANNLLVNVASQNIACVNCQNVDILDNRMINPGAVSSVGGPPGSVPIDLEPNAATDKMLSIRVNGNLIDASGSIADCGAGGPCALHGVLIQSGAAVPADEFFVEVKNNRVIGAKITDASPRMSGAGIWANIAHNIVIADNYVQRTYDGIRVTSTSNFVIEKNRVVSVGFTGNTAMLIEGTGLSGIVRNNVLRSDASSALVAGEDTSITEDAGAAGNGVYYADNYQGTSAGGNTLTTVMAGSFVANKQIPGGITLPSPNIGAATGLSLNLGGATLLDVLTGTASLNYAQALANTCETLTLTVTGSADGDDVSIGVPHALVNHNTTATFTQWISAANTVSVRRCVVSADGSDPAAATIRASVRKF